MKLDRGLFRDPATMTFPSRLPDGPYLSDPEHHLPPKVAEVTKDVTRGYPHTKRVGNYLLGKTLGEGSFAKVKESLHILTGERVAIKVIDKKKAKEDAYVRKNMRREGKLLQMARHRHVLQLYEIMETENSYYLVTELCSGGDLMDHICAKKKLEEKETKRYIRSIISAVHYLHSAGILHRDLKVENLLLDENKEIKIIDFGLSNAVRVSQSKDGHVAQEFCVTQCGSPAYAAPELLGNKKYGPQIDIWSIGVNMYAMLTGNLPFTVEPFNIKTLHNKMLSGDMNPVPDNLSKHGKDFLKQLLNPNPEQRITLQEAMCHPWITDARNRPLEPAPFPNKLSADDLDNNILKHMSQNLDYRLSETIRLVTSNIPSNATSTYHMFYRKLKRYNAEMRVQGKVSASEAQLISSSRSTQNTSGYASRDDVIDLVPLSSPAKDQETKRNRPGDSEGDIEAIHGTSGNPSVTSRRSSGTNPVRVLHRQGHNPRQVTFHGHDTKPHTAQPRANGDPDHPPCTAPTFRPSTTRDKPTPQEGSEDVQFFKLSTETEPARKVDTTKLWVTPHSKRVSTKETKISHQRADPNSERSKHVQPHTDLPAIAEKPASREDERHKRPSKSLKSPLSIRRARDVKPTSNYSFRPRGAFTDTFGNGTSDNKVNATADIEQLTLTDTSAAQSKPHFGQAGRSTETPRSHEQNDKDSDSMKRRDRRQTNHILNGNKFLPRNLLIDVAHYERYSRKNGSQYSAAAASADPASVTVTASLQTQSVQSSELQSRKPLNLTYPSKMYRPGGRNFPLYSRNRFSVHGSGLNVTGAKTGVSGSRVTTLSRDLSHDHNRIDSKLNCLSIGTPEAEVKKTTKENHELDIDETSSKPNADGANISAVAAPSSEQDVLLPDICSGNTQHS